MAMTAASCSNFGGIYGAHISLNRSLDWFLLVSSYHSSI
jgi:hypothetical protein